MSEFTKGKSRIEAELNYKSGMTYGLEFDGRIRVYVNQPNASKTLSKEAWYSWSIGFIGDEGNILFSNMTSGDFNALLERYVS